MKFCPYCGTKNQDKYNFCIKCHEPLPSADGTKESFEDIDKSKGREIGKEIDVPQTEFLNKKSETAKSPNIFPNIEEKKEDILPPVEIPQKKPESKEKINIDAITVKIMGKDDFAQAVANVLAKINIPKTISKDIRQIITEEERRILQGLENNNKEAEQLYKMTVLSAESLLKFGNGNYLSGNVEGAISFFEKALEKDSKLWPAWYNKGVIFGSMGKYDEAIRCFDEVLKLDQSCEDARLGKGICLRSLGKTEQAIECFDALLASNPNNEEVHTRKGIALADLGRYEEAIKELEKALAINPKSTVAKEMKECVQKVIFTTKRKEEAISNLKEESTKIEGITRKGATARLGDFGLTLNLTQERLFYNKGMVLAYQGDYEGAIKCFDEALKINKNFEKALASKGIASMALGMLKEVMDCFDKAISLNPNDETLWIRRGIVLGEMGKYSEMLRCVNKALALNPQYEFALKLKERLQEINRVSEELEKAVVDLYKTGAKLPALGKYEDAIKHIDLLLIKNPSSEEYWSYEGSIILHDMGSVEDAIKSFDKSLKVNPGFSHAWFNKGMLLARLGRAEDAIKCFDEAIKLKPEHNLAWYNRGAMLGMLGVYDEALRCFERAQGIHDTGRTDGKIEHESKKEDAQVQSDQSASQTSNKRIVKIIKRQ